MAAWPGGARPVLGSVWKQRSEGLAMAWMLKSCWNLFIFSFIFFSKDWVLLLFPGLTINKLPGIMFHVSSRYGPGVYLAWPDIMCDVFGAKTLIISHISVLYSRSGKNAQCLPQSLEWPGEKFLGHGYCFFSAQKPVAKALFSPLVGRLDRNIAGYCGFLSPWLFHLPLCSHTLYAHLEISHAGKE